LRIARNLKNRETENHYVILLHTSIDFGMPIPLSMEREELLSCGATEATAASRDYLKSPILVGATGTGVFLELPWKLVGGAG